MEAAEPSNNVTSPGSDKTIKSMPTLGELHDKLDSLWISYLDHLDEYTASQKLSQNHMRSGFISLARANFEARNGVRKFGQDYHHERAIATKRIAISTLDGEASYRLSVVDWNPPSAENHEESESPVEIERTGEGDEDVRQLPSPPGTPAPKVSAKEDDQAGAQGTNAEATKKTEMAGKSVTTLPLESDPLRWFGILVPASLRSAQASFRAALLEAVAQSVSAAKAMRSSEVEIRKLRKEIRRVEKGTATGRD